MSKLRSACTTELLLLRHFYGGLTSVFEYTNTIRHSSPQTCHTLLTTLNERFHLFRLLAIFITVSITERVSTSPGTRTFPYPPPTWSRNRNTIFLAGTITRRMPG